MSFMPKIFTMDKNEKMETESTDSSSDEDEALEKRAEELEKTISDNKYLYDAHVELVGLYKKLADLKSMRLAFERFYEAFPLTPSLWLTWLKDEMQLASSETEKRVVLKLFDKATEDYLSVGLWLEYAQFAMGCCELEETRSILERALAAGGLHTTQGSLLWDTIRELELAHLSLSEPKSEAYEAQLQRVVDIFKRQLSVPLLNMESTYNEWVEFIKLNESIDGKSIEWGFKNALKSLEAQKPFEDRLLIASTDEEHWTIYQEYIKSVKDPSLKICLYERAIKKLCLNPYVWIDYCSFMYKLGEAALNVSLRAVRNVSWVEDLWVLRLNILEKFQRPEEEIIKSFEEALASITGGLELWLTLLGYIRRNSPNRLMKLFDQAEQQLPPEYDPTFKIPRLKAHISTLQNDIEGSRNIWNKIMQNFEAKSNAKYWLEYINFERQHGTKQQLKSIFSRALTCCKDYPLYIAEEWLMFEHEQGSLDDIISCNEKLKKVLPERLKAIESFTKESVPENDNKPSSSKRKNEAIDGKTKKFKTNEKKFEKKALPAVIRNQGPPKDLDKTKAVFISNLSSLVTTEQLKEIFPNGTVTLATNNKGESRCFGYVQFSSEHEAEDTLKRDREPLNGRPIFISKCKGDPSDRQQAFKFATNMENNKLFVRGLPIKHKQEDVEAIFKPYGYTDVRLVLHKSGQSKGLAYVDFANSEDAEKALKATNQMHVDGHIITVAISAPPSKNKNEPVPFQQPRNSKSRLEFVPRSLQVKKADADSSSNNKPKQKSNEDFRNMLLNK